MPNPQGELPLATVHGERHHSRRVRRAAQRRPGVQNLVLRRQHGLPPKHLPDAADGGAEGGGAASLGRSFHSSKCENYEFLINYYELLENYELLLLFIGRLRPS